MNKIPRSDTGDVAGLGAVSPRRGRGEIAALEKEACLRAVKPDVIEEAPEDAERPYMYSVNGPHEKRFR